MTIAKASPRRVLPSKISKHRYNTNNSASPLRWLWEVSLCPFFSRNTRRRSFLFFWSFFLRNSISDWSFFVLFCIARFACGCYLDITNILANPAFLFCSLLPYRHHTAAFSCKSQVFIFVLLNSLLRTHMKIFLVTFSAVAIAAFTGIL